MRLSRQKCVKYIKAGKINILAFVILVKTFHRNSTIYDYLSRDIHKKFNLSRPTYNKYVKALIEMGDAVVIGKNLVIKSFGKDDETGYIFFNKSKRYSVKDIAQKLSSESLLNVFKAQRFIRTSKLLTDKLHNPKNLMEFHAAKRAERVLSRYRIGMEFEGREIAANEVQFTIETLKKKSGLSQYSLYKTLRGLVKDGLISIRRDIKCVGRIKNKLMKSFSPSSNIFVSRSGYIYSCGSNLYTLH